MNDKKSILEAGQDEPGSAKFAEEALAPFFAVPPLLRRPGGGRESCLKRREPLY